MSVDGITRPKIDRLPSREHAIQHGLDHAFELLDLGAQYVVVVAEHSDGIGEEEVAVLSPTRETRGAAEVPWHLATLAS